MRIDTNSDLARAAKPQAAPPARNKPTEHNKAVNDNKMDLARTDALDAALKATPDVRPEQVARAKALIQDPSYPSTKVVDQVAGVLAKGIRRKE